MKESQWAMRRVTPQRASASCRVNAEGGCDPCPVAAAVMPREELAIYAGALGELLRGARWTRERRIAHETLCAMELTHDEAAAVIDHAIEHGILTERDGTLTPAGVTTAGA